MESGRVVEIRKCTRSTSVLLVGALAVVLFCAGAVVQGSQDAALFSVLGLGAGMVALLAALNLMDRDPQIVVSDTEIVHHLGDEPVTIPFDRIRSLSLTDDSLNVGHCVDLNLDDGTTESLLCAGSFIALDHTAQELLDLLDQRLQQRRDVIP